MYMSRFVNWPCGRELGRPCHVKLLVEKWLMYSSEKCALLIYFKLIKILKI
jgi:hypothetical protein